MKLILLIIFTFLLSASGLNNKRQTLIQWYNEINSNHSTNAFKFETNAECVNQIIGNLNKFGNQTLNFIEAMIIIYGAALGCTHGNVCHVWMEMLATFVDSYKKSYNFDQIVCFQYELMKSVNQNVQKLAEFKQSCLHHVDDEGLKEHMIYMENKFGSFDYLTCGAFTSQDFKIFLLSIITLTNQQDQKFQIYKLSTCLHAKLNAAIQCTISRVFYQVHQQFNVNGSCLVNIGQQLISNLGRPSTLGISDHCVNNQIIQPFINWFADFNNNFNENFAKMQESNNVYSNFLRFRDPQNYNFG
ncbi:unnamed protein product [Chironomus riparius]|uniref:Uncharacterized protein n=1 Tax=Chironomus riparius TaxID=315576 RepID=A0A9N9WY83_9DIPT|nr:unnamed protein product [Chironomus riparius]